ncbi:MAG: ATPase [Marinilabiliales bacterium]|nr:MAG: ATPase [Marinilabiliales bacterium]
MTKIAIPLEGEVLAHHFGHSKLFFFAEIENNKLIKKYNKVPPPHAEGVIPNWLADENATDVLVGGIGPKAIKILNERNINVFVGVEGADANKLVSDFISNDLKYGENFCQH